MLLTKNVFSDDPENQFSQIRELEGMEFQLSWKCHCLNESMAGAYDCEISGEIFCSSLPLAGHVLLFTFELY